MKLKYVVAILVFYGAIFANLFMNGALSAVLTLAAGVATWSTLGAKEGDV